AFLLNLVMSVTVVIAVLAIFMGWRAAIVVGGSLLLTVSLSLFFMNIFDIKVERISLGALIIAMGMLVDNAIVVAEGMQVQMRRGRRAIEAADSVARRTQIPLLGATAIGILAFAGIGLSPDSSGEFMFSLFAVIAISLTASWVLAVTATPLLASYFFRTESSAQAADPFDSAFFRAYGRLVGGALRIRYLIIILLVGATLAGLAGMGAIRQQFFPPSTTPILYLNYQATPGTSIHTTSQDLAVLEDWLLDRPEVVSATTTAGASMTRFLLTYTPEDPDSSYGQIVVRVGEYGQIPALREALTAFSARALPWAETRVQQIIYGPPVGADVEARLSGPDAATLRSLAAQVQEVFEDQTALLMVERTDWRQPELVTQPIFASDRAQRLGITRNDLAIVTALATDGLQAGNLRETDRLIPIILRTPKDQQLVGSEILDQPIYSSTAGAFTSVAQVVDGFEVLTRNTLIHRRDRVPTISVQAFTAPGVLPPEAFVEVRAAVEAIPLPAGYRMEWGGEYETSLQAQESLARQMPLALGSMFLITLLLFGKIRQTLVIWTVVPMAVTGVSFGLLMTGLPFSFTALLGLLSLSGMLIKNAIVLVEEIDTVNSEDGLPQREAIIVASISRLRPVVLASATTILGMIPLLSDDFFAAMAVSIMAGLGFASILTLIGIPAIYHTYLRKDDRAQASRTDAATPTTTGGGALLDPKNCRSTPALSPSRL
ncbi:MAG: efflux RND transporter permease subunit, partial [Pseudomonadota bacterium]